MNIFGSLAVAGLLVAGSARGAGAEAIYYYVGNIPTEAASDTNNWQDANKHPVNGIIIKTEGPPTVYRFKPGIYDGSHSSAAWLIGENKNMHVVSDGPLTIQKWGKTTPLKQGVITAQGGEIVFGDNVSIHENISSGEAINGGGAIFSNRGITFGANASLIENRIAPSKNGGAIFLDAPPDGKLVFGTNAFLEKNEAYQGGAVYARGSVTLGEGAIIRGNRASQAGGALYVTGTLDLASGSLVEANKADGKMAPTSPLEANTADGERPHGGAIYIDGTAAIQGTAFKNNTAIEGNGGAIYISGNSLHFSGGSLMESNKAFLGGAVFADNSDVDINDTSFITNNAGSKGGALYVTGGSLTVQTAGEENGTGTLFQGNTANSLGGAIYAENTSVTLGDDTRLENNQATAGGALYVLGEGTTTVNVSKALFKNNTTIKPDGLGGDGGAIYAQQASVTLEGTRLESNQAKQGGAVFANNSDVDINDTSFITNNAGSKGGALYVTGGSLAVQTAGEENGTGTLFQGNTANSLGGAIYAENTSVTLGDGTRLENNQATAGGALYVLGDGTTTVDVSKALFKNNTTIKPDGLGGDGGAIHAQQASVTLEGTRLEGNQAKQGGAVFANNSDVDINDTSFITNNAGSKGGALYVTGGSLAVQTAGEENGTGTLFQGNTANSLGGAIYAENTSVTLGDGTRLENNQATAGGALYVLGDGTTTVDVSKTLFKNNTTIKPDSLGGDGGAIYAQQASVTLEGTRLEGNQAKQGGAVYVKEGTLNITDTAFRNNTSLEKGGAISLQKGDLLFKITATPTTPLISGNTSAEGGFLYLSESTATFNVAEGAQLQIGDPSSASDMDSLGIDASSSMKKTGGGELRINSNMDKLLGTVGVEAGTMNVTRHWEIKNAISVTGGTLNMPSFSFSGADSKLRIAGGTLATETGQIFETPLNAAGENEDAGGVKVDVSNHMDFTSGLIAFHDAKYNLQYAGSAAAALGASYGQQNDKEITFTGELYTPSPDPEPGPNPGPEVNPEPGPEPAPNPEPGPNPGPEVNPEPGPNPGPEVNPEPGPEPAPNPEPSPNPGPEVTPEPDPNPSGTVTIEELNANNINDVVLGNVTIATGTDPAAGKNLIVGATAVDDPRFTNAEALPGSIGSRNIDLGANGSGVAVVGDHYLTLVGNASDTPLILTGNLTDKPVDVLVGGTVNGQPSTGTLNLGTQAMPSGGILNGTVRLAKSSTLNVRAGEFTLTGQSGTEGVDNNGGALNVAEGAALNASIRQASGETNVAGRLNSSSVELEDGKLNVSGIADIRRLVQRGGETAVSGTLESASVEADEGLLRVIGTLKADNLDAASGLLIEVGDANAAGKLHVASASLGGAGLFLDPEWRGDDTLKDASHAVLNFRNQEIDGKIMAGRNALLVLGDASPDWTLGVFDASDLRWGPEGFTAAASVRAPQRLDPAKGALTVDGSLTTPPTLAPNTAFFADHSLFVVDASGLKGGAALTAQGGTLTVADTAALLLGNVTEGEYVITEGFTDNAGVRGWEGDFLTTPDQLIGLTLDKGEAGIVKVRASALDAGDVFPDLALRNIVNEVWGAERNDVNSPNMGISFLSRAVNESYLSRGAAAGVIDGAAQIAVAGGVQGTALSVASAPIRAVQDHASLSRAVARKGGDVRGEGINLWIDALYGANRARDFGAGSLDGGYNVDFGGVVFGGDVGTGPFRIGVALDAGGGTARSRGDFASTKNDFDFWGITLYGSWTRDRFNLMADAGYSEGSHEVRQDLPASLYLGQLKADVDTHVVTAGLRAEYLLPTTWVDVMPHVGARYSALTTGSFSSHIDDQDVFRISRDTQRIWTFPVGVTFGKDIQTESGWKVKPRADLSVVPATGDTNARTHARVSDVTASDAVHSRIVDAVAFDGSVGLELEKDNISLSLKCGVQASKHQTGQNVALSFTYTF